MPKSPKDNKYNQDKDTSPSTSIYYINVCVFTLDFPR